jgi:hypothetical protein
MPIIKKFDDFNKTLYIFDLDDTLVKSPKFEELAIEFLKENVTIKDMLRSSVGKIGVNLSDIKWENGRLYVEDPLHKLNPDDKNWIRKGKRVYLITPDRFSFTDISLPVTLKELSKLYDNVEDKCIVTARPEDMRSKILETMKILGLKIPKYGIHMFPKKGFNNSGIWKGEKIVELISKNGFKKAHFYDDNSKVVNRVKKIVTQKLPDVDFEVTKVK